MSYELAEKIARSLLYEGYILYPYRTSAIKNRKRFAFGSLFPENYRARPGTSESSFQLVECLLTAQNETEIEGAVRFLRAIRREVHRVFESGRTERVDSLRVEDCIHDSWEGAEEHKVLIPRLKVRELAQKQVSIPFAIGEFTEEEMLPDSTGTVVGCLRRACERIQGNILVSAAKLDGELFRLSCRIENRSVIAENKSQSWEEASRWSMQSTHSIFRIISGSFISLLDPPDEYRLHAEQNQNMGSWPVLIGLPGEQNVVLASPIILYDYPQIAPESAGDLFDATEIDEMLTLRIMTLTDEEKREMRNGDERARQILERTESLPPEYLSKVHGAIRAMHRESDNVNHSAPAQSIEIQGIMVKRGSRVRLRPKRQADILDIVLRDKIALVESVEQDFEGCTYVAVVIEDDPGKEFGILRQPGHRFFFALDEVEPL